MTILDRLFWQHTANPYGNHIYDWESWAAYDWHIEHWAPRALRQVTDGRRHPPAAQVVKRR